MGLKVMLMSLFHGKPGRDGVWDFLGKRAVSKSRIELEKIRNKGTQEAIRALRPGGLLREGGSEWSREIRMPDAPPPPTAISVAAIPPTIRPPADPQLDPPAGQRDEAAGESCR
jgi:hypothetical protein